jgi:PIN domain nuclease of toxin-antitoxin system
VIVLDTHAWLWWIANPKLLSKRARSTIESADALGVCSISGWELATLVRKHRLELDRPVSEWVSQALGEEGIRELTVSAEIAVMAGSFGDDFHGDPADRLIAATSLFHGAPLVTRDEALRAMPMLKPIW